jgi:hypothetical protein
MNTQYHSKDYVVLLEHFSLDDELKTNKIFDELKDSGISIVGSNGGSYNWHFIINFKQVDDLDHCMEVKDFLSFVLLVKKIWTESEQE